MTIENKFKKLTDLEHVLLRPGRYIGSITPHTADSYVLEDNKFIKKELTWNPAFIKIFDEIVSNSVDFSKTTEGSHLDHIDVLINKETGNITVTDNGGIVVDIHKEHEQYIPEMIFELKAGSNFNDDSDDYLTGQNGEGSALTNIFSKKFVVNTADGKKSFLQTHTENSKNRSVPVVKKSNKHFTTISYDTDFERFGMNGIDDGNYAKLVKRVVDVAGCNHKIKVHLNGKRIAIKSFKDYIKFYTDEYIFDSNDNWKIGVSKSDGSFSHVSFVNNTETISGGAHVSYIADQIVSKLRAYIQKKHKIEVKPTEIKNHLNLFIDCNIVRPRYSSQTKELLITEIKNFGTTFEVTDKFINNIIQSEIVQAILDWVQAKENAMLQAELRKLNKNTDKVDPIRVDKFDDATEKRDRGKCILFLTEGLSAASTILSARGENAKYYAVYALKGKPINVQGVDPKRLMDNEEFKSILTITGLKLGVKVTHVSQLRFGKICVMSDADCISKDHAVLTVTGAKPISQIAVGDMVKTHTGEYKPVTDVNVRYTDDLIKFTVCGDIIKCTPDHKLPVMREGKLVVALAKNILITDKLIKLKHKEQL